MKKLTKVELTKLSEVLTQLEKQFMHELGLTMYNGGFVSVDMYDYDDDEIYIKIESGIQAGGDDDYSVTEEGSIDRTTFELLD